jgi:hypothetical protein
MHRSLLRIVQRARRSDEHGIALVLSLFLMMAMSVIAASLMFLSQTETYSTMNYRMMSQARYGAESGIQLAANYLLYTYTPPSIAGPDTLASFQYDGVSPVTYNGQPVVLSANPAVVSNYPYAPTRAAFAALGNTMSMGATNTTTVSYAPYATLMSMELISAGVSKDGLDHVIQTWQVTSDGAIANSTRNTQVEVTAIIDTQKLSTSSSAVNYAFFALASTCGAIQFSGASSTKSYNSAASAFNPTLGAPSLTNGDLQGSCHDAGANANCNKAPVGTNGNLTESGGAHINGTLSTPRSGVGACSAGNVTAETTSGGATVEGGIVPMASALSLPAPTIPTPNLGTPAGTNLSITNMTTCASIAAIVPAANCIQNVNAPNADISIKATAGTPLVLGNVNVTSGAKLTIASDATNSLSYTVNALSASGGGTLTMGAAGNAPLTVNAQSISTSGGATATFATGTYNTGTISVSGGTSVSVASQSQITMNIVNSFSISGGGTINLPMDNGAANPATVQMNIVDTPSVATPLNFSGGTVTNNSFDPSRFIIEYAGTGNISMSGGTKQAVVVYAPRAAFTISGGSAMYGEVVASTIKDTGGTVIYYDRNLATKGLFATTKYFPGNPMLSSFSWKKY